MIPIKIYNLEKFALTQIFRPYQSDIIDTRNKWGRERTLTKIPCPLSDVVNWLEDNPAWQDEVMERISRIPFDIPTYIDHQLVDFLVEHPYTNAKHNGGWLRFRPSKQPKEDT